MIYFYLFFFFIMKLETNLVLYIFFLHNEARDEYSPYVFFFLHNLYSNELHL